VSVSQGSIGIGERVIPSPFLRRPPDSDNLDEYARSTKSRSFFKDFNRVTCCLSGAAPSLPLFGCLSDLSSDTQLEYVSNRAVMLSPNPIFGA
jgi:hypothetical protein